MAGLFKMTKQKTQQKLRLLIVVKIIRPKKLLEPGKNQLTPVYILYFLRNWLLGPALCRRRQV